MTILLAHPVHATCTSCGQGICRRLGDGRWATRDGDMCPTAVDAEHTPPPAAAS